jgi:hypothetical protein
VLQWYPANAAAVPAKELTIEADAGGDTTDVDAGGETGEAADDDADVEVDAAAGGDTATRPEDSAALRPWTDPLPHPTTMIPITTAHATALRAALIRPPRCGVALTRPADAPPTCVRLRRRRRGSVARRDVVKPRLSAGDPAFEVPNHGPD